MKLKTPWCHQPMKYAPMHFGSGWPILLEHWYAACHDSISVDFPLHLASLVLAVVQEMQWTLYSCVVASFSSEESMVANYTTFEEGFQTYFAVWDLEAAAPFFSFGAIVVGCQTLWLTNSGNHLESWQSLKTGSENGKQNEPENDHFCGSDGMVQFLKNDHFWTHFWTQSQVHFWKIVFKMISKMSQKWPLWTTLLVLSRYTARLRVGQRENKSYMSVAWDDKRKPWEKGLSYHTETLHYVNRSKIPWCRKIVLQGLSMTIKHYSVHAVLLIKTVRCWILIKFAAGIPGILPD